MREVGTIGLDLAKNVFQVHGVDAAGSHRSAFCCAVNQIRDVTMSHLLIQKEGDIRLRIERGKGE